MLESLKIVRVDQCRSRFMPLLLVGDESEPMVRRYLGRCTLYVGYIGETAVAVCATTDESEGVTEVKNLAVLQELRRQGIGRAMLGHAERQNKGKTVILGTGETPSTQRFYRSCGYSVSGRIAGFFKDNYPEPIVEEGITLCDMIYFEKRL